MLNLFPTLSSTSLRVNVLVCKITDKKGKTKQFSWVTDLILNHKNLKEIMLIGRSRWKIENETGRHSAFNNVSYCNFS